MISSLPRPAFNVAGVIPPADGTVTLPEVIEFHAKHNPSRITFQFYPDNAKEPTLINSVEFFRATDRVAHHFRPGRQGAEGEIIAVLALSDSLLYHAVSIGLTRAGIVPFLMSPRNTAPAIVKMLKEVNCHKLLTTQQTLKNLVSEVKAILTDNSPDFELQILEMPPFQKIYPKLGRETADDPFEPYPKVATRPPLDEPLLYLHSSGSTGFPKSIKETFRIFCHWSSFTVIPEMSGMSIGCMHLPPFHTLGVIASLLHGLYGLCPIALYPPVALTPSQLPIMPTPDNIIDHFKRNRVDSVFTIPTLIQLWAQDSAAVDYLATLKLVAYAGGAVPTKLGNFVTSRGVTLCPIYGGTEFGGPTYMVEKRIGFGAENDWEWLIFDEYTNVRWEAQGDGTFECVFLTNEHHQLSVENLDDVKGYATSDLFIPHPSVPNYWKIVGRKDDVIIHTSGEKTVPGPMENVMSNSPYIMGVVMFGRDHDQPGMLIELKPPYAIDVSKETEVVQARNMIWPIVEEANRVAPTFSKVFKELILFTTPDKPLPRAGKGTVMRKASLSLYSKEIEEIYQTVESTTGGQVVQPPPSWSVNETEKWLKRQIEDVLSADTFDINGDLFEQGMDSLSATILRRRIVGALQYSKETAGTASLVTQNTVYNNPSIKSLAQFIVSTIADPESIKAAFNRVEQIEELISKYNAGLTAPIPRGTTPGGTQVLITGTTGNLGSEILEALVQNPEVTRVYALNRVSGNALAKHEARFLDKGFDVLHLRSDKVVLLESDITQKDLGLGEQTYGELLANVTVVIHTSWRLDFNLQLESFEPSLRGVHNLVDFARRSNAGANMKFLFTSSVAGALSWDQKRGPYPEEVLAEAKYAIGTGYGESKYVSERIITGSGINATSFRIGQIVGGKPNGAWAITDWVPIFVKSSIALNALPSQIGGSSWIPMDSVAQCIIDVALGAESAPALNLVHPRPVPFDAIISAINDGLVTEKVIPNRLPVIPTSAWVALLEARAARGGEDDIQEVPATKLLDFFRGMGQADSALRADTGKVVGQAGGMPEFSTLKAQALSTTIQELPSIADDDAHLWVKYWRSAGLFN